MSRSGRPPIVPGIHESKTLALYRAGQALLAERDYEAVSMAELAACAGLSVGAVYVRFADKEAFLNFLLTEEFQAAARALIDDLAGGNVRAIGLAAKAERAGCILADQFIDSEFAGLMRAAVKRGFAEPSVRVPFEMQRDLVTNHLLAQLTDGTSEHAAPLRAALGIVLAALTYAALSEDGEVRIQAADYRGVLTYLLTRAVSGEIKLAHNSARANRKEKTSRNPSTISAFKKPAAEPKRKPPTKPKPTKPAPDFHSSPTRKV